MLAPATGQATLLQPTGLTPTKVRLVFPKWMRYGLSCIAPQSKQKPRQPWMDRSTLDKVTQESAWKRQWFRLQHATLSLKKTFWFRPWKTGVAPLQVGLMTLLHGQCAGHPKFQTGPSSPQAGAATMEGTAGHGNCCGGEEWESQTALPVLQKHKTLVPKMLCRSSFHLELLRLPRKRWPLCGSITLPRISTTVSKWSPLRIWQTP